MPARPALDMHALLERMLDFQESLRDSAYAKGEAVRSAARG